MRPLLAGGAAVQLRAVALNIVFLAVTRATQGLDSNGVAAAAHSIAIQVRAPRAQYPYCAPPPSLT